MPTTIIADYDSWTPFSSMMMVPQLNRESRSPSIRTIHPCCFEVKKEARKTQVTVSKILAQSIEGLPHLNWRD